MSEWIRVTKKQPCRICGHDSWCLLHENGTAVICMREENGSPKQFSSGEVGYIHRLVEDRFRNHPKPVRREESKPSINAQSIISLWAERTRSEWLLQLSEELGVKPSSLMELRAAWAPEHSAWAFPMRNSSGQVVGIRLRARDGRKWAVTGSKQGLFVPICIPEKRAYICEGVTDTAAALSIGLFAIGRPSCSGGLFEILETIKRLNISELVIISDNDKPGLDGAETLTRHLQIPSCTIILPAKDVREFVNNGGTSEIVDNHARQTRWICPQTYTNNT